MKELRHISPASVFRTTALIFILSFGVLSFLGGLLFIPLASMATFPSPADAVDSFLGPGWMAQMNPGANYPMRQGFGAVRAVGLPFLALFSGVVYGFLMSLLATLLAWLYNKVAGWVGGIQVRASKEPGPGAPQA